MKVKLATQLLSQSVADALRFCKDTLKIKEFCNAGAIITFIELFNHGLMDSTFYIQDPSTVYDTK